MAAENGHRGSGIAAIMGIGKAVPAHVFPQKSFPDYYFDISNSSHMVDLKAKFTKIYSIPPATNTNFVKNIIRAKQQGIGKYYG
uniref:Chalcone/stilbene synthase N-terminal domain-containing protein n=1 Tax=Oryza barthii TaxID=65489 RepID=A0A0D3EQY4_9ORYZ